VELDARLEIEMGLALQPVEKPARRVLLLARHLETRQPSHAHAGAFRPSRSGLGIFRRLNPHHAPPPH